MLGFTDEVVGSGVRRKRNGGVDFDDMRVDELDALVPPTSAVIAVEDKVRFTHLIDLDRRQGLFFGIDKCVVDTRPALHIFTATREEGAGKVGGATNTADNRIDGNAPDTPLTARRETQLLCNLLVQTRVRRTCA